MMSRTVVSRRSVFRLVVILGLVGMFGFGVLMAWSLYWERIERIEHARIETGNLSHVLEEHALATIQKVDLVILDVLSHLQPDDMRVVPGQEPDDRARARRINRLLKDKIAGLGEADILYVANAHGEYIYSSLAPIPNITIADRDYFATSKANASAGLVISRPLVSRTLGTWAITLSRRVNFDDGSFAGLVNVVIQLSGLETFYRSLNLGSHGTVLMRDSEMRLVARHPALDQNMGESMPEHPVLRFVAKGVQRGSYLEQSPADGIERLYSFRQVANYPLYVLAGFAVEDYLAEWWLHVFWSGIGCLVMIAVTYTLSSIARRGLVAEMKAEAELERYNQRLEKLVDERTRELETARHVAEAANRAKSTFVANMSHELRTPLNAILGFTQLLIRKGTLPEETARQIGKIDRAGQHLLMLINSVLSISRIESGRVEIACEPFNLRESIGSAIAMVQTGAEAKGLDLVLDGAQDLPDWVLGDEGHLRQILINLLGNAVKYTERGGVKLSVTRKGDMYRFEVSDSGPGIETANRERVFQAFFQAELGLEKADGVGLGLAISREYAKLMGGELTLESDVGKGSTFSLNLRLPECVGHADLGRFSFHYRLMAGVPACRILVVDDEADDRELMCDLLAEAGLSVRTVENGAQAFDCFCEWQPQLIWLDMNMPVLDGSEVARRLRLFPGGDGVKIVALTASVFEESLRMATEAGCDELVYKPIDVDLIFDTMSRLLRIGFEKVRVVPGPVDASAGEADLSLLPGELRRRLCRAAESLETAQTREIIQEIRQTHAGIATFLDALAQRFCFDRIAALCRAAEKTSSGPGGPENV